MEGNVYKKLRKHTNFTTLFRADVIIVQEY